MTDSDFNTHRATLIALAGVFFVFCRSSPESPIEVITPVPVLTVANEEVCPVFAHQSWVEKRTSVSRFAYWSEFGRIPGSLSRDHSGGGWLMSGKELVACLCGASLRANPHIIGTDRICPACKQGVYVLPSPEAAEYLAINTRAIKQSKKGKARWRTSDGFEGFVEEVALHELKGRGWQGIWAEDAFFSTVTALLFWDVVFARLDGVWSGMFETFPSEQEDMPRYLFSSDFAKRRQELLTSRIAKLRRCDITQELSAQHSAHYGKRCRMVWNWDRFPQQTLVDAVQNLGTDGVLAISNRLLEDYGNNRRGLPDLFIWRRELPAFAEVKGTGDKLSTEQTDWLAYLSQNKFKAFVVNVHETEENG